MEPVLVAWDGRLRSFPVRIPSAEVGPGLRAVMTMEGGDERDLHPRLIGRRTARVDGLRYTEGEVRTSLPVPFGYHHLAVEAGGARGDALVLSAPRRAFEPSAARTWGVFLPLYALHSDRSWGVGDFGDLRGLLEWADGLGASVVATLPLLAAFLDEPFDPSPYSPVSRLFWNELFLDVTAAPELERDSAARALVASPGFRDEVDRLRREPLVDHRQAMALKRKVLESLAGTFWEQDSRRAANLAAFLRAKPEAEHYARFRAATERRRLPWGHWPAEERTGRLPRRRSDEGARRYHLYVQLLCAEQMAAIDHDARVAGSRLYFDFPLGVSPDGYDVWRERDAFVSGASAGAPPDAFFGGGQDWGFPPLHPERIREQGYRYPIACFRHLLRHAGVLRIDHAMSLHRLYFVPSGFGATRGAYVRYRAEELYAILSIESRRNDAIIAGEDLGTVPHAIRQALTRHGVLRSYVMEFEVSSDPRSAVRPPPAESLASLNTHDVPTFAAFWRGADLDHRRALVRFLQDAGTLPPANRRHRRSPKRASPDAPEPSERAVLRACLAYLASSRAYVHVVNLEDLWLETRPQNVPGTTVQNPNWRRRARHALEELDAVSPIVATLREVDRRRRAGDTVSS
jgi:4-alpha-glucanotransferase